MAAIVHGVVVVFPSVSYDVRERGEEDRDFQPTGISPRSSPRGGDPLRRQRWNDVWNRAATKADLPPGTTPHDLRHFYASLLISKGASVKAVQSTLRHRTATETLNTYAHLWSEDNALVRRALDAELNPIVGIETTDPTAGISRTSGSQEG